MEEKCDRESPRPIPGYKYGFYTFPFLKCFSLFSFFVYCLSCSFFFPPIFLLISLISSPQLEGGSKNIHYESGEILKTGSGAKLTESATLPHRTYSLGCLTFACIKLLCCFNSFVLVVLNSHRSHG